jgi:hypothetical protein
VRSFRNQLTLSLIIEFSRVSEWMWHIPPDNTYYVSSPCTIVRSNMDEIIPITEDDDFIWLYRLN